MTQIVIPILEGPGTVALFSSGFRKKDVYFSIRNGNATSQRIYVQIERATPTSTKDEWMIGGTFRMEPYVLTTPLDCIQYNSRTRKGTFYVSVTVLEEHPVCGHFVYPTVRFCHICGKDKMDVG
jgi:hypothetical protein